MLIRRVSIDTLSRLYPDFIQTELRLISPYHDSLVFVAESVDEDPSLQTSQLRFYMLGPILFAFENLLPSSETMSRSKKFRFNTTGSLDVLVLQRRGEPL